jgi:hypothetical protein
MGSGLHGDILHPLARGEKVLPHPAWRHARGERGARSEPAPATDVRKRAHRVRRFAAVMVRVRSTHDSHHHQGANAARRIAQLPDEDTPKESSSTGEGHPGLTHESRPMNELPRASTWFPIAPATLDKVTVTK